VSARPALVGIVNVTEDSFSDGGLYLAPQAALAHARALVTAGADIIDLGAASSRPNATPVPSNLEIERLEPLVAELGREGFKLSIDTFALETQRWALAQGVEYLNDIHGFARSELYPALAATGTRLIVMHALQSTGPARRDDDTPVNLFDRILAFFESRIAALSQAGIAPERLILDPGMGLFLGRSRDASFAVLRHLSELRRAFGLPVLISVSRKSFLRPAGRSASEAGAATLAAELFAAGQGVDYIRTHDPAALDDGLRVLRSLDAEGGRDSRQACLL